MAIHMRKVLGGAQPPRARARSGGLPERSSSPQQTTDFHRTMAKVCKSGGEGTFAGTRGNGDVAPKAVIPLAIVCGVEATRTRIATYLKGQRWSR